MQARIDIASTRPSLTEFGQFGSADILAPLGPVMLVVFRIAWVTSILARIRVHRVKFTSPFARAQR